MVVRINVLIYWIYRHIDKFSVRNRVETKSINVMFPHESLPPVRLINHAGEISTSTLFTID